MEKRPRATSVSGGRQQLLIAGCGGEKSAALSSELGEKYEIHAAQTGKEALEQIYARKDELDLILLSLNLPDRPGMDVLKQICHDPLLVRLSVIALSDEREAEPAALDAGAMDFIYLSTLIPGVALSRVRHAIELSINRNIVRSIEQDPLTGLYNKDFFFKHVLRFDAYHMDVETDAIVVNINHFHMINERYGRAYGDDVLRRVGEKIQAHVAPEGLVCRRDNDTFLIYLPHGADYQAILDSASSGMDRRVRLRMGVYSCVDKQLDVDRRFDRAKLASDALRNSFVQTIAFYDEKLHKSEIYMEQLLEDFPRALADRQFTAYYQPKFAIQGTMPVLHSAEALVRWLHPQLGLINPGDFIPLFEGNGLIRQLDSYVWREVAAQMRDWKDRLGICVPVSVNVSRIDMFDQDLVDQMVDLVNEFHLSPDEFLLEITESAYTQDSKQIIDTVNRLREAGFHIEIDDFGSGYSSLNMISTLPMDALKLDMEFMRNAFKERKNTKMLDAVIDIAYSLDVPTIAEGVETAEQMFALKEMGCDIVQGFYFSRPVPAAEFEPFLIELRSRQDHLPDRSRESSIKPAEQFAYEALHDPYTGLYNHSAYKMLLKDADQRNIALLLVDMDDYEFIHSHYGAETANLAANLIADVLRHNFRSVDFICRISNDEFAIIMTRVNHDMGQLISEKVERINHMLQARRGDLPPLTLSVGVAFADREHPQGDIFHDADLALQRVKLMKKTSYAIY